MTISLNEQSENLMNLLLHIPPRLEDAENLIKSQKFTSEELTSVAINYAEECTYDIKNVWREENPQIQPNHPLVTEGFHSTFLYEVLELLLQYGLDVNAVLESNNCCYNIMSSVMWVDNGYVAADSMRLLLENGGDPDLIVDCESVYDELTFDIFFGAVEQELRWLYDCWVHTWFVLLSFGDKSDHGCLFPEPEQHGLFSLEKLRDHRNYDFCLSRGEDGPVVRIFDKKTLWEVAYF